MLLETNFGSKLDVIAGVAVGFEEAAEVFAGDGQCLGVDARVITDFFVLHEAAVDDDSDLFFDVVDEGEG